jgi:hypothetical protein
MSLTLGGLYLIVCPEIAGGGQRLFDDGLPASKWALTHRETGNLGEIAMVCDRAR